MIVKPIALLLYVEFKIIFILLNCFRKAELQLNKWPTFYYVYTQIIQ